METLSGREPHSEGRPGARWHCDRMRHARRAAAFESHLATDPKVPSVASSPARRSVLAITSLLAFVAALGVSLWQVEVSDAAAEITRSCGSAFDSVTDRSGWEQWWARDLDEPNVEGTSLLRSRDCPDAVNRRIAGAASLAGIGGVLLILSRRHSFEKIGPDPDRSEVAGQLATLGRRTSVAGATLTLAGIAAVVVLVADSDSTLFLYTDRFVVGIVGLVVLMPTIALFLIGRAISISGFALGRPHREEDPP